MSWVRWNGKKIPRGQIDENSWSLNILDPNIRNVYYDSYITIIYNTYIYMYLCFIDNYCWSVIVFQVKSFNLAFSNLFSIFREVCEQIRALSAEPPFCVPNYHKIFDSISVSKYFHSSFLFIFFYHVDADVKIFVDLILNRIT